MLAVILIIIIAYLVYTKYYDSFEFGKRFVEGRYIRLERDDNYMSTNGYYRHIPINYANIMFISEDKRIITPSHVYIYPALAYGNGVTPIAKPNDPTDIVLVETIDSDFPVVEYTLPMTEKISQIIIINRNVTEQNRLQEVDKRMKYLYVDILNEHKEVIFRYYLSTTESVYNIYTHKKRTIMNS